MRSEWRDQLWGAGRTASAFGGFVQALGLAGAQRRLQPHVAAMLQDAPPIEGAAPTGGAVVAPANDESAAGATAAVPPQGPAIGGSGFARSLLLLPKDGAICDAKRDSAHAEVASLLGRLQNRGGTAAARWSACPRSIDYWAAARTIDAIEMERQVRRLTRWPRPPCRDPRALQQPPFRPRHATDAARPLSPPMPHTPVAGVTPAAALRPLPRALQLHRR